MFSQGVDILAHKSLVFTQRLTCRGITDFIDKPRNSTISCWSINVPVRSPHWVFNSLRVISKAFRALHARMIRAKPRGECIYIYEESRRATRQIQHISTSMNVPLLNITAVCCGYFLLER